MAPTYEFKIPAEARRPYAGCVGRACVYARVSGENDPKTASMETQAQGEIDALVAAGFFLDPADIKFERFSGIESLAYRPLLLELRDLVEAGHYQAFAVHDPDRLVRGSEVLQVVQDMEAAGCQVWINGKPSEPSEDRDLILMLSGWASKKEAKQIRERTTRVRRKITEGDEWFGAGPVRYGYRFEKETRRRVAREEIAAVVRRIFEMIDGGMSNVQAARALTLERIPGPGGKSWSPTAVARIIREETYLGKAFVNRWRYARDARGRVVKNRAGKPVRVTVPRAEWVEIAPGKTDRIIADDLWRRANARAGARGTRQSHVDASRQEKRPFLLRGFLLCGQCRQRMHCSHRNSGPGGARFEVYVCQTRYTHHSPHGPCDGCSVGANKAERMARPILDALIADPTIFAAAIEAAFREDDAEARLRRDQDRTRESIARLNRELAGYVTDLGDPDLGERSRKAIRDRMTLIGDQIDAQERHARELDVQLAAALDRDHLRRACQERCDRLRLRAATAPALDMDGYRQLMEALRLKFFYHKGGTLEVECQPTIDLARDFTVSGQSVSGLYRNGNIDLPPLKFNLERLRLGVGV